MAKLSQLSAHSLDWTGCTLWTRTTLTLSLYTPDTALPTHRTPNTPNTPDTPTLPRHTPDTPDTPNTPDTTSTGSFISTG